MADAFQGLLFYLPSNTLNMQGIANVLHVVSGFPSG